MSRQLSYLPFLASALLLLGVTEVAAGPCDHVQTQLDENTCANATLQQANANLNQVYTRYKKQLTPDQQKKLNAAQTAWRKYRDASCVFESSGDEGGSAHTMIYLSCLTTFTDDRTKALQALSTCPEGDLSCPSPKQ